MEQKLQEIFRKVLNEPTLEISDDMTGDDVRNWDSLNHIDLIASVENEFNIKFTMREIKNMANVGEFKRLILEKQG